MSILLNQDYNKGFNDGRQAGRREGMLAAKQAVAEDFVDRLQKLRNEKGIGPKTWDKIIDCLDINKEVKEDVKTEAETVNR